MKLGLQINQDQNAVPSLSRLHLSSLLSSKTSEVLASLQNIITVEDGEEYIKDDNDTFHIERPSSWSSGTVVGSSSQDEGEKIGDPDANEDRILNYSTIVKHIVVHNEEHPFNKQTPYFNHHAFYANLDHYQSQSSERDGGFGEHLLYGEVVTSTNTILEKYDSLLCYFILFSIPSNLFRNTQLLRHLPSGFTATATIQVAGRGRGSNVWVSPAGSLIFSTVIRHPVSLLTHAPVIFLQYLAALAIVEGVKSYDVGFANIPVKLKWPNDICKSYFSSTHQPYS